jgi:phage/plasmid-associated DNA primase
MDGNSDDQLLSSLDGSMIIEEGTGIRNALEQLAENAIPDIIDIIEHFDDKSLHAILMSPKKFYDQIKELRKDGPEPVPRRTDEDPDKPLNTMDSLKAFVTTLEQIQRCSSNGALKTHYERTWTHDKKLWGRYYGKGLHKTKVTVESVALQGLVREVRGTLCHQLHYDIDIENCVFVAMSALLRELGIPTVQMDIYVQNRKQILEDVIRSGVAKTRFEAKMVFFRYLFGRNISYLENDYDDDVRHFLNKFHEEMTNVQGGLMRSKDPFIKNLHKGVKAKKNYQKKKAPSEQKGDVENVGGSLANIVYHCVESLILHHMCESARSQNVTVGPRIHDGFHVQKDTVHDLPRFLKKVESDIWTKLGISITLTQKEFTVLDISEELEKLHAAVMSSPLLTTTGELVCDQTDVAEVLVDVFMKEKTLLYSNATIFVWTEEEALFLEKNKDALLAILTRKLIPMVNALDGVVEDQKAYDELKSNCKSTNWMKNVTVFFQSIISLICDGKYVKKRMDMANWLFPIGNNLVVDLEHNRTRPRLPEDYFSKTTDNVLLPPELHNRKAVYEYLIDVLATKDDKGNFQEPSEAYMKAFLLYFGYCLTNFNDHKKMMFLNGPKDAGKSLMMKLMISIFGNNIFATAVSRRLLYQQKGNDSLLDLDLICLDGYRFGYMSEPGENDVLRTEFIKRLTGVGTGGMQVKARDNSGMIYVDIRIKLASDSNFPSKYDDTSFDNRLHTFNFNKKYEKDLAVEDRIMELKNHMFTEMVNVLHEWVLGGRKFPKYELIPELKKNIDDAKLEMNTVAQFFNERILTIKPSEKKTDYVYANSPKTLFAEYTEFCKVSQLWSLRVQVAKRFHKQVVEENFLVRDESNPARYQGYYYLSETRDYEQRNALRSYAKGFQPQEQKQQDNSDDEDIGNFLRKN